MRPEFAKTHGDRTPRHPKLLGAKYAPSHGAPNRSYNLPALEKRQESGTTRRTSRRLGMVPVAILSQRAPSRDTLTSLSPSTRLFGDHPTAIPRYVVGLHLLKTGRTQVGAIFVSPQQHVPFASLIIPMISVAYSSTPDIWANGRGRLRRGHVSKRGEQLELLP